MDSKMRGSSEFLIHLMTRITRKFAKHPGSNRKRDQRFAGVRDSSSYCRAHLRRRAVHQRVGDLVGVHYNACRRRLAGPIRSRL